MVNQVCVTTIVMYTPYDESYPEIVRCRHYIVCPQFGVNGHGAPNYAEMEQWTELDIVAELAVNLFRQAAM